MNKSCAIFLSLVLIGCLSACKKDVKPQIPSSLIGKWYIRQDIITASLNGVTSAPYTYYSSDTATTVYYQFNNDGTGLEQTNFDPNFLSSPPISFNYKVSGTNIVFSHNTNVLMSTSCSFTMPTNNTLVIHGPYSYSDGGGTVNSLQDLYLSR